MNSTADHKALYTNPHTDTPEAAHSDDAPTGWQHVSSHVAHDVETRMRVSARKQGIRVLPLADVEASSARKTFMFLHERKDPERRRHRRSITPDTIMPGTTLLGSALAELVVAEQTLQERGADLQLAAEIGQLLLEKNSGLESALSEQSSRLISVEEQNNRLVEECELYKNRCQQLTEANQRIMANSDSYRDPDTSADWSASFAEDDIVTSMGEITFSDFLQRELTSADRLHTGDVSTDLQTYKRLLREQRRQQSRRVAELEQQVSELQTLHDKAKEDAASTQQLRQRVQTLTAEKESMEEDLYYYKQNDTSRSNEALQHSLEAHRKREAALSKRVASLERDLDQADRKGASQQAEIQHLSAQVAELTATRNSAKADIDKLIKDRAELQVHLIESENFAESLASDLEKAEKQVFELRDHKNQLETRLEEVQMEEALQAQSPQPAASGIKASPSLALDMLSKESDSDSEPDEETNDVVSRLNFDGAADETRSRGAANTQRHFHRRSLSSLSSEHTEEMKRNTEPKADAVTRNDIQEAQIRVLRKELEETKARGQREQEKWSNLKAELQRTQAQLKELQASTLRTASTFLSDLTSPTPNKEGSSTSKSFTYTHTPVKIQIDNMPSISEGRGLEPKSPHSASSSPRREDAGSMEVEQPAAPRQESPHVVLSYPPPVSVQVSQSKFLQSQNRGQPKRPPLRRHTPLVFGDLGPDIIDGGVDEHSISPRTKRQVVGVRPQRAPRVQYSSPGPNAASTPPLRIPVPSRSSALSPVASVSDQTKTDLQALYRKYAAPQRGSPAIREYQIERSINLQPTDLEIDRVHRWESVWSRMNEKKKL